MEETDSLFSCTAYRLMKEDGTLENMMRVPPKKTSYASNMDEFKKNIEENPGFIKAHWCGCRECEDKIKEDTGATTRCIPFAGGEVGKMEESILDSYGLTKADFEVPKMPRLGSHGLRRSMRFQVWDAHAEATDDGVLCEFSINKGSYATAVLREIMKIAQEPVSLEKPIGEEHVKNAPPITAQEEKYSVTSNKLAVYIGWTSNPEFPCCPIDISDNPLQDYLNNLKIGKIFVKTYYGESLVHEYTIYNDKLLVITKIMN